MTMTPRLSKFALTVHITSSVGWFGAVAGFLVLSIAGLASQNAEVVHGAYLSMNLIGLYIIVPLSLAALTTGLVQALGTEWGLLRHYWVLVKLMLTVGAATLLMLHQFKAVAAAARRVSEAAPGTMPQIGSRGTQLVGDAGLALLALLVIATLSVFKPWGRTRYGMRKRQERRGAANLPNPYAVAMAKDHESQWLLGGTPKPGPSTLPDPNSETTDGLPLGLKVFAAVSAIVIVLFGLLHHISSGALGSHAH